MSDAALGVIETKIPSRLDRLPWSRFHWLVVLGLGTAWILDGLEVTIVGSVASRLTSAGSGITISTAGIGEAAAFYVAGACIGALVFGHLTDRFGRKKLFLITLGLYMVATAVTALSFDVWFFFIFRFLTGAGIGGEYAAINSAIDELIPARARGRVDLVINGSFWIGSIFGSALALFFLDTSIFPKDVGWRLTFALGVVLAAVVMLVRRHVPESPRWLFIHGYETEAEELVERIEKRVADESGSELEPVERTLTVRQRRTIGFRSIVHTAVREYPRRSLLCLALFVGQAFIYNGITFNLGTLMTKFFHVSTSIVPVFLILYAGANFLGPLLLGRLFDTVGRVPMITATYLGSALLGILLAGIFAETTAFNRWTFIVVVMVTFFMASAGASAAYLTSSEIFPMETRALAIAFFYAIGTAVGGIAGPLLFGPLITTGNAHLVALAFFIGAVLMATGAAAELAFGVRAERQQLEDVAKPLTAEEAESGATAPERGPGEGAPGRDGRRELERLVASHHADGAAHRAAAADHRARVHEILAAAGPASDTAIEVEDALAQVEDERALASEERAGAVEARIAQSENKGGTSGAGSARFPARAAELRARSHDEVAESLLSEDDREAERHKRLAGAALERARAAEQLAMAHGQGDGAHGEEGVASEDDDERGELETEMHEAWAEMHEHRARALEFRAAGRTEQALEEDRTAEAHSERARALSFRSEAAAHRARSAEEQEHERDRGADERRRESLELARAEDERVRQRVAGRRARDAAGFRRYRPGPGRLGRAPGTAITPPEPEEVLDHEIAAIERALDDHGPTDRSELLRMVGGRYWGPGVFSQALREAVAEGAVRRLSRRVYGPAGAGGEDAAAGQDDARRRTG